ncbi:MAG: hypothetical protein J5I47_13785, partial [Vicingus serpentipes]|nr:hypothetical protein [Vicingus serpentipes]
MKKIYSIGLLLIFSQLLFSQNTSTGIGRWKLGVNVGGTFQSADISTKLFGLGYGATLEYAFIENTHSPFGFSLRGQFLQGKTYGHHNQLNNNSISNNAINGIQNSLIDYSNLPLYLNNRTSFNEFSLEAMLKLDNLYQKKGILFYLYVGGGFTNYIVETDQTDGSGKTYDYSLINHSLNKKELIKQIKSVQDGNYETELINPNYNPFVFTPTVGMGFGFRVLPGFDIAFEHKISAPQSDLFDGQVYKNKTPEFIKDIYHYSSI